MPDQHQEAGPRLPARFGAQIVPRLGAGTVDKVVCGLADGRPVALTCEDDRCVRVWDMGDHRQVGPHILPHDGDLPVWGVAYGQLGERSVAVLVGGGVCVWDLSTRRQVRRARIPDELPSGRRVLGFRDVACARLGERLVAVTGGYGEAVWIWDVATGEHVGGPLYGHTGMIWSVVCGVLNGRPIAATAGEDGTVRIWDLDRQEQIGGPLTGHTGEVHGLAYGLLDGRPVLVSGGRDQTLRLWELQDREPAGIVLAGHTDRVDAVALTTMDGRTLAVSGGEDVRVWDLRTRRQIGPPLFDGRDVRHIHSLACGTLHGRPVALAVSGCHQDRVRVWDLREHRRIGDDGSARHAPELPRSWTDPATGDVYDLTRPLIDRLGDRWALVDYDGIEPIVCQYPLDPYVTLGIADAHFEFGFDEVITPGPNRRGPRVTHSTMRQYYEFRVLDEDREPSVDQLLELSFRFPGVSLSSTRMVWDFDPDDDDEEEPEDPGVLLGKRMRDELLCSHFDAFLEFQACGKRLLMFRLPTSRLGMAALRPYLADRLNGLQARRRGSSLLVGFRHDESDGELAHRREQPTTWLKPLLPLRADLAAGDLSAAYLGWLKAVQERDDRDALGPPPRPATLRAMSPQLSELATLLHLNSWSKKHLP